MKKLLSRGIVILIIILGILVGFDCLTFNEGFAMKTAKLTNSEEYLNPGVGSGIPEISQYIEGVRNKDGSTILVIGDSLSRQLFSTKRGKIEGVSIQTANAAINITGQYMLACEYLENHPNATDIWLFQHPMTIRRTFDTDLGYPYAVMPFAYNNMLGYLDKNTTDAMASVYGRPFLSSSIVKLVYESPLNRKMYLGYVNVYAKAYEQSNGYEMAEQYISKLYELCKARNVSLHFLSSPSTEYYRKEIEACVDEYRTSKLYDLFPDYYDSIIYFPTELTDDWTHFSGDYQNWDNYATFLDRLLPEGEFKDLIFAE